MISADKKDLEYVMKPIVTECLTKHISGENYFNELDGMIKYNETLLVLFLMYAVQDSGVYNVIMSGGIGLKYIQLQLQNKIPSYINIMTVNGGLRKGKDIVGGIASNCRTIPDDFDGDRVIFIDDSFYSGKTANKVKEGVYQYLANIFLCNVGAGAALFASEQMVKAKLINPLTPLKKLGVIFAGITATGIVGGSIIANYISKKCVDPLFGKKHCKNEGIYSERKPEPLDIALHADDIATAGILSGFRWIEPALPVMYFISGYRAGIGYRNNSKNK